MYTHSWKSEHHAVSRVHLQLPFFSVEPLLAVCRLSAATTSLADYQSELVLQGSNLHFWFRHQTGFLLCLRPALWSIFWRNAPECLHDLVLIRQQAVAKPLYYQVFSADICGPRLISRSLWESCKVKTEWVGPVVKQHYRLSSGGHTCGPFPLIPSRGVGWSVRRFYECTCLPVPHILA